MIYIGIPVHDERQTIGPLLWRIRELLHGQERDFHLLVLDDASTDGTSEALEPYGRILPISLLRADERVGYAASLERLLREVVRRSRYPRRDALVTLQADFSDPPEAILEMVKRFEGGADLVLAGAGRAPVPTAGIRLARWAAHVVARSFSRLAGVADPFGSFRLYRLFTIAGAISDLPSTDSRLIRYQGWAANAELLMRVRPHARRVEEVDAPLDHARRYRESRFRPLAEVRAVRRAAHDPAIRAIQARLRTVPSS